MYSSNPQLHSYIHVVSYLVPKLFSLFQDPVDPRWIKSFLPPFYPWHNTCEKRYQALLETLQDLKTLQDWEQGYLHCTLTFRPFTSGHPKIFHYRMDSQPLNRLNNQLRAHPFYTASCFVSLEPHSCTCRHSVPWIYLHLYCSHTAWLEAGLEGSRGYHCLWGTRKWYHKLFDTCNVC